LVSLVLLVCFVPLVWLRFLFGLLGFASFVPKPLKFLHAAMKKIKNQANHAD
jgi:hypothetical protein